MNQQEDDLAKAQEKIRLLEKDKTRLAGIIAQKNDGTEDLLDQVRCSTVQILNLTFPPVQTLSISKTSDVSAVCVTWQFCTRI